jgi:hypothetical protein
MLNGAQRRRLLALLGQARGRPGSLSHSEQEELRALIATLQPRLFLGSATRRLSPLPVPKQRFGPSADISPSSEFGSDTGENDDGRGGFRTCDLSRVKRALSH